MTADLQALTLVEDILSGQMKTNSLILAHKLGVFTCLADGPQGVDELAKHLRVGNADALAKLLQTLHGLGLVEYSARGYQNTAIAAAALVPGRPSYYGEFIDFFCEQYAAKPLSLLHRTICPQAESLIQRDEEWTTYMLAMECASRLSHERIVRAVDLSMAEHLLDLGGGPGLYTIALCRKYPNLRATIYDLEASLAVARKNVEAAEVGDRIRFVAGSALDNDFAGLYDAVFVSHTIHLFNDSAVTQMFRNCAASLTPGGRLIVRDFIMNAEKSQPLLGALISMNMWIEGQAYSYSELERLLAAAGFTGIELVTICDEHTPAVVGDLVVAHYAGA